MRDNPKDVQSSTDIRLLNTSMGSFFYLFSPRSHRSVSQFGAKGSGWLSIAALESRWPPFVWLFAQRLLADAVTSFHGFLHLSRYESIGFGFYSAVVETG